MQNMHLLGVFHKAEGREHVATEWIQQGNNFTPNV